MTAYQHPIELIEAISRIKTVLSMADNEENERIKRTNPKLYKKSKNPIENLLDYLMNNIPSDFYLMKYSDQMISKNYS